MLRNGRPSELLQTSMAKRHVLTRHSIHHSPHFFKKVRISAVALIKMVCARVGRDGRPRTELISRFAPLPAPQVMHARSGGNIEVMGLMQGKIMDDTMIIMDSFELPVEGTETRVNAAAEGYEYMVTYLEKIKEVGRLENAIGWYHSHPGYGCWLSGIDVSTQLLNQQYQEPWLAIVVSRWSLCCADVVVSVADSSRCCPDRPEQDHLGRQSRNRRLPNLPQKLQTPGRRTERIPDHPAIQNRRLWCARESVLPARDFHVQV